MILRKAFSLSSNTSSTCVWNDSSESLLPVQQYLLNLCAERFFGKPSPCPAIPPRPVRGMILQKAFSLSSNTSSTCVQNDSLESLLPVQQYLLDLCAERFFGKPSPCPAIPPRPVCGMILRKAFSLSSNTSSACVRNDSSQSLLPVQQYLLDLCVE